MNDQRIEKLFSAFGIPSLEEWKEVARQELDGEDPDTCLIVPVDDDGFVPSLVRIEETLSSGSTDVLRSVLLSLYGKPKPRWEPGRWCIRFPVTRTECLREESYLDMLKECPGSVAEILAGISTEPFFETIDEAERLILRVQESGIDVSIDAGDNPLPVMGFIRSLKRIANIEVFIDPFRPFVLSVSETDRETVFIELEEIRSACTGDPLIKPIVSIDGSMYHRAGASIVQELGFTIAAGIDYIRSTREMGFSSIGFGNPIRFTYAVGTKFLFEIAKLRAARLLWAAVQSVYGVQPSNGPCFEIHAVTSPWNMTLYDRYTNILRATVEALAAVIGGASALSVFPFDGIDGIDGALSHRLARNTSLILDHESGLSRILDPAGGSYAIELLTDRLARSAWSIVRELEMNGGFIETCRAGIVTRMLRESSERRQEDIACRRQVFVGTSKYPDKTERIVVRREKREVPPEARGSESPATTVIDEIHQAVRDRKNILVSLEKAFADGATLSDVMISYRRGLHAVEKAKPFPNKRGPEPFERIRLAVDRLAEKPVAMILHFGSPSVSHRHAEFVSEILSIAGLDVRVAKEENLESIGQDSPVQILVVCSDDDTLLSAVSRLQERFASHSLTPVLLAVSPSGDRIETLRKAGVRLCFYPGMNVLNALFYLLKELSIPIE
ncbi:MAG: methylmalonyl-CoA mutase family protein [Bacteroidota bacterium]|nr:methylmalonyl-CoA mutase family protein [Bacteroidota bacterium]